MKQLLFYLLQVIAASGLLYGYYHFALRNKRFHRYNRFYILMAVIISIVIPFLNIPVYFTNNEAESSAMLQTLQLISSPAAADDPVFIVGDTASPADWFTLNNILYTVYLLTGLILLIRILFSFNKIRVLIKNHTIEPFDKIKFVNTDEAGTPFSFFRWLFWNRKIDLHSEKGEQIFRHELFHIQQKHSWDIVFIELITVIFWVNPFFHLMRKEIKAIHEFLADEFAIKKSNSWQYAELLLMQVLNTNNQLVNPFFHNQIKRRIAMITTSTNPSYFYLRKIMALPIAVVILFLFAFNIKNNKSIDAHEPEKANNSITVVVDAGHGGTDAGAKTRDGKYNEAQLTLEIAKKIETIANEYNINVIMTRKDEKIPGGATTKNDALRKRVDLVNKIKPDAFIAIHVNTTAAAEQKSKSGFDGYVTKQRDNHPDIQLATAILSELNNVYKTRQQIRQREDKDIFVLDKPNHPSFLLECGYINNQEDLSFITNKKNQETIARAILKGIVSFVNTPSSTASLIDKQTSESYDTIPKVDTIYWKKNNPTPVKRSPTAENLKDWQDPKMYGVWLDGKRIANSELSKYKPADFDLYYVSKLEKNAVNYGKHYYQVDLYTRAILIRDAYQHDTTRPQKPGPLFVIDGKVIPSLEFNKIDAIVSPNDIESITVLKDQTAIDKYGEKGRNGVIVIKTKTKTANEITGTGKTIIAEDENVIFEKVEIEPAFVGGYEAWKEFCETNLNGRVPINNKAPEGNYTVVLRFIVDKDGNISDLQPLTHLGYGMEEESIRVMKLSPKWKPAIQNGYVVKAYRKQPFNFVINKK